MQNVLGNEKDLFNVWHKTYKLSYLSS